MNLFNQITTWFENLTTIPAADLDDARRRRLLSVILISMLGIALITLLTTLILLLFNLLSNEDASFIIISCIVTIAGAALFYVINRFWSGKIASTMFLVFFMLVLTLADTPHELTNGRSLFLFALPIIIASVLLGSKASFVFYVLTTIEISILSYISGDQTNPTINLISFFFLTIITWLSARSLEQALNDLRTINANLDKIVTERTHALAESLARERVEAGRNQAILSSIADGVVVFNAKNAVLLVNPALSHLTEIPMQDLTGIKLNEFLQAGELAPASRGMIKGLIENPDKIEASVRVEWGKKTLSVSIARVQDTLTNENIGTVAVFRDITHEAELEKMKNTFVGIVSHELRTPLNAIIGHTEMLKESIYGSLNEKQASVIERIIVNTRRLLAMVGDLLDEAQMKAGKLSIKKQVFKTSSLLENMHATMDKITTDKGLYLTDEFDPNMPETITGDPQRLQQIIVNLVNNSAKFTSKGGIHVCISRSGSDASHWKLEVSDTGSGIPEKEIPYIFETFRQAESSTTRQHGGFGLGLSIVKQLVELMNGQIVVRSDLNKGSTFTITLPFQN
jgi:PAS domain S-box-containing protein